MTTREELAKWEQNLSQERKWQGTGAIRCWANVRGEVQPYIVGKGGDYETPLAFMIDRMVFLNSPDLLAHELGFSADREMLKWMFQTMAAKDGGMQVFKDMLIDSYHGEIL